MVLSLTSLSSSQTHTKTKSPPGGSSPSQSSSLFAVISAFGSRADESSTLMDLLVVVSWLPSPTARRTTYSPGCT